MITNLFIKKKKKEKKRKEDDHKLSFEGYIRLTQSFLPYENSVGH